MYDIIIVGAGTAGMSAAIYGLRAGKSVLLLEAKAYGGQIINTPEVENYPGIEHISGFDFATNLYNQVIGLGAKIIVENVTKVVIKENKKVVITEKGEYEGGSVILATGAKNRKLGLPNEEELTGAGISYCATCDGAFFRGKDVAVIGGGNTALEDANFLSSYCTKVSIIHRRDSFRGEDRLYKILKEKENVEFILNSTISQLIGDQKLEGIVVQNLVDGSSKNLQVSGLFIAIGQMPENHNFADLIELDKAGYIIGQEDCKTNQSGIFVAGDCRTKKVRQLATAAADGAVAALSACEYLS